MTAWTRTGSGLHRWPTVSMRPGLLTHTRPSHPTKAAPVQHTLEWSVLISLHYSTSCLARMTQAQSSLNTPGLCTTLTLAVVPQCPLQRVPWDTPSHPHLCSVCPTKAPLCKASSDSLADAHFSPSHLSVGFLQKALKKLCLASTSASASASAVWPGSPLHKEPRTPWLVTALASGVWWGYTLQSLRTALAHDHFSSSHSTRAALAQSAPRPLAHNSHNSSQPATMWTVYTGGDNIKDHFIKFMRNRNYKKKTIHE